jgi:gliding motility-associated-like protein
MKNLALIFALCLTVATSSAQIVGLGSAPEYTGCGYFLEDTGGAYDGYSANEDIVMTLCFDGSQQNFVNAYFAFVTLGIGDTIRFYSGNEVLNTSLLGEFTGAELANQNITSFPGQCLTIWFTSNGDGSLGEFAAAVDCTTPCLRPLAAVSTSEEVRNPSLVCVGEEVTFNASASEFYGGAELGTWEWFFDDGTTNTSSWPEVTHSFDQPGVYVVQLYITDDTGCENGNLISEVFFVSTTPTINLSVSDDLVCTGQEVNIDATYNPTTWDALPDANFGEPLFVPDVPGQCFSSELTFQAFPAGSTLADIEDLLALNINFEHSYMGDLVVSLICPSGQSVVLHQQGGTGTFLGEPVDDESDTPGVGYDYSWSPTATNGTWVDNSGGTLAPGTYESVNDMAALEGCPLNGDWELEICDLLGADNGFVFGWSIDFDPSLFAGLVSFTPSIGAGCDSSFWSGPSFATIGADCDNNTVIIDTPGQYSYTYTVIDNFGCTYTAQESIEVYPGPIPSAGEDVVFCGTPVGVQGSISNPVAGVNYTYAWSPTSAMSNPNSVNSNVVNISETTDIVLTVFPTTDPQCLVRDTLEAFVPVEPISWPLDTLYFCPEWGVQFEPLEFTDGYTYSWEFAPNLVDERRPFAQGFFMTPDSVGYYYLTTVEPFCGLTSETPYWVLTKSCDIIVPNVFSPNGDSFNNFFVVASLLDYDGSTLRVFNRWGALIYESDDYKNNWSPSEDEVPDGVYYYILTVNTNSGKDIFEGHLTILR